MLTLTLHCIGPLVAAGAFDKSMDDESRNDLLSLDNVYKAETKESLLFISPEYADYVEQHDTAVRNGNIYNWLRNVL
jgi:hypothetical protein